jgi:dipeptidyl aminopeptidase/acylaminoacyl peptidase
MQDDITDATKWLISQNLAIPNKICIVGGSFGGYAALEGAVKEPALYACAAAIAPVSDLPRLLHRNRGFAYSPPKTGQDTGQLQATSPAQHADRIQIPILMIDGRMDYTVWPEQTEMMEAALKAAGKTEQTVYLPNADHFFTTPADRLAILNALEPFLAQNLAGSSGTP